MKKQIIVSAVVITLSLINNLFADGKRFAASYTAATMPQNEFEIELLYFNNFGKMSGSFQNYAPKMEVEYGVLDNLTASLYFNFTGTSAKNNSYVSEPLNLESNSLELRYRLGAMDQYLIDPALYFEFEYGKNVIGYEPKIILSKEYKNIIGVINIASEFETERSSGTRTTNFDITGGALYELDPFIACGIEFRHDRIYDNTFGNSLSQATFLGPTINIKNDDFSLTVNIMKQLSGSPASNNSLDLVMHENYEFSAILEIEL